MIKIYGIKNCNKIRDTRAWLDKNELDYEFVDLKKEPLTRAELTEFADKIGLDVLVNRRGMKWRQLGLSKQNPGEEDLFDLLLEHQVMIKRPLIENDGALLVGYDEDAFENFFT